jgi:hypothetical protein
MFLNIHGDDSLRRLWAILDPDVCCGTPLTRSTPDCESTAALDATLLCGNKTDKIAPATSNELEASASVCDTMGCRTPSTELGRALALAPADAGWPCVNRIEKIAPAASDKSGEESTIVCDGTDCGASSTLLDVDLLVADTMLSGSWCGSFGSVEGATLT